MNFEILHSIDEIWTAWKSFSDKRNGFAFQMPDWFLCWSQVAQEKVVVLHSPREIFLPCRIMNGPLGIKILRVAGGPAADYEAPFVEKEISQIKEGLKRALHELKVDGFYCARSPRELGRITNPLFQLPNFKHHENSYELSTSELDSNAVPAHLPKKLFADSQRQKRRLEELGKLVFRTPISDQEAQQWFNTLVTQKRELFAARNNKLIFDNSTALTFYREITSRTSQDFKVHLSALLLNDRPIAIHWGLEEKQRYTYLLPSYDQGEYRRFSPGRLHLLELLKYCKEKQIEIFDFSLGDESYKKDFCHDSVELRHCFLARSPRFHLYTLALRAKNEIKRRRGAS